MSRDGHIELDWAVEAIRTGPRARHDIGDLTSLTNSIATHGLLQPITVSPDGILLCGARRLAAVRNLGMRTVSVWVRAGLSTRLQRLIAEQDENTLRQPLLPTEAATLYQELKQILTEDATRRQEATRFGADDTAGSGPAKLAAPQTTGDTRRQAAQRVTGGNSYTTLERVNEVQKAADDDSLPAEVRQLAASALQAMDTGGKVNGHYQQVRDAVEQARRQQLTDLADAAISRATAADSKTGEPEPATPLPRVPRRLGVRAFLLTWNELDGWADQYDPTDIGRALTPAQFDRFAGTVQTTTVFLDTARDARAAAAS